MCVWMETQGVRGGAQPPLSVCDFFLLPDTHFPTTMTIEGPRISPVDLWYSAFSLQAKEAPMMTDIESALLQEMLPHDILRFFKVVRYEIEPFKKPDAGGFLGTLHIYLVRDKTSQVELAYAPNGFTEEARFHDCPIRTRRTMLHVRRRRWLMPTGESVILQTPELVFAGTRYSKELGSFLKATSGLVTDNNPNGGSIHRR